MFINAKMGDHIRPEGWHNWGKTENEKTAFYAEYNSNGGNFHLGKRVSWAKVLSKDEVKRYTKKEVLGEWKPF